MNAAQALAWAQGFAPFGGTPGLMRMRRLLRELGNPEEKLSFVHIAGTNGKGSTAAYIAAGLQAAGVKTGLFVSPYILCFRERIQFNGRMISGEAFAACANQVRQAVQKLERQGERYCQYDIVTAVGLLFFLREQAGMVVLETGLGGRLDSTNAIPAPAVAVLTSISLDHTAILGDTIPAIAAEKAGILKPGSRCVCTPGQPEEAAQLLRDRCAQLGIPFVQPCPRPVRTDVNGSVFALDGQDYAVRMLGPYQIDNAAAAVAVLRLLDVPPDDIRRGLLLVQFPARLERMGERPLLLLDGAHNPGGIQALCGALELLPQPVVGVAGMLADKDYAHALPPLVGKLEQLFVTTIHQPRALEPESLAKAARQAGLHVVCCPDQKQALARAKTAAGPDGSVVVFGSLFLASEIRARLTEKGE